MSLFAGLTSKVGSLLAQPMVQSVGAGLLTGAIVGSVLVASGAIPLEPAPVASSNVALLACPGFGPAVAEVPSGQAMLVTARSEDGNWLQVYVGTPAVDRAWAPASALALQAAVGGLPVAGCESSVTAPPLPTDEPTALPAPSIVATVLPTAEPSPSPGASPTPTPRATPTPVPTPTKPPTPNHTKTPTPTPTKTPTPTVAPTANAGPALSNLSASPNSYCSGPTSTITVSANDPDGVQITQITYTPPGASPIGPVNMTYMGGTTWRYFITPSGWNTGFVAYHVTAYDTFGVSSTAYNVNSFGDPSYLVIPDFC